MASSHCVGAPAVRIVAAVCSGEIVALADRDGETYDNESEFEKLLAEVKNT
jgi:hypothetical protein